MSAGPLVTLYAVAPAVGQHVGVVAAGFLQGIGQYRQAVERTVGVDRRGEGQGDDGRGEPIGLAGDRSERVGRADATAVKIPPRRGKKWRPGIFRGAVLEKF